MFLINRLKFKKEAFKYEQEINFTLLQNKDFKISKDLKVCDIGMYVIYNTYYNQIDQILMIRMNTSKLKLITNS